MTGVEVKPNYNPFFIALDTGEKIPYDDLREKKVLIRMRQCRACIPKKWNNYSKLESNNVKYNYINALELKQKFYAVVLSPNNCHFNGLKGTHSFFNVAVMYFYDAVKWDAISVTRK